jgi:hypothetical protein
VGQWSLPIILGLVCCQYSHFDPLRVWYKNPCQETYWRVIENLAWHTTSEMRDNKYKENYCMPYETMEELVA